MTKDEKQCPFCAEIIKNSAIKCRFCFSELTKEEISPSKQIKNSKKFESIEEEEIDYAAEKVANRIFSIIRAVIGLGIIALIFYFIFLHVVIIPNSDIIVLWKTSKSLSLITVPSTPL